jgi:ubiquinone/menaquinone biosynthesis C-methylase UbiE
MTNHKGEHEIFDQAWSKSHLFYNEGDIASCRTFRELFECIKFQRLAEFFPNKPVKTLEVGCGSGGVSLYFHNTRNYEVELVDLSDEALRFAEYNFSVNGRKPLHSVFRRADAVNLPYPGATFDLVMSFGLLEHFTDIDKPISEQMRVLKPGGIFFSDIVTERFSVDTVTRLPGIVKKAARVVAHGKFSELPQVSKEDFFENNYSFDRYLASIEKYGGTIQFARGNRPYPRSGNIPLISSALLNFYKSRLGQRIWENFDKSDSAISRFWGAGWWVLAKKE